MSRLIFIVWKEFLELRQNPRLLVIVIVAPIVQLTMLGYAASTDVRNVPVVVADGDRSRASLDLIARFEGSPSFTVVDVVTSVSEIDPFLERSRAWMALSIPAGYGDGLEAGEPQTVQVVADGTDSNSANVALGYANGLIAAYAQEIALAHSSLTERSLSEPRSMAGGESSGIDFRPRIWFNPQLDSRHFMIPGVLALLLLVVTSNLSSMGIVRERELGTLEQLNVTPIQRWELIVGKLLPYGLIGLVDVLLVVMVTTLWFEVPLRGSFALLFLLCLGYLLCTLGLGLFVSTISNTQQQAMMTTIFFFLTPMIYLSGFIFPIENMPVAMQYVTYLIPLRYFLVIVRGIFLKGVGLSILWPQALAMVGWGVGMLALAVARSRKTTN